MNAKILLLEARPYAKFDQTAYNLLKAQKELDIRDKRGKGPGDPDFMAVLPEAEILLMGNDLKVTAELLQHAPKLKLIAKFGVGLDMIDIPACSQQGIIVHNSPGCNNQAVADQTIGLALALLRKIPFGDSSLRQGSWEHLNIMGRELWQKTLGLIGLGAIGRAVAQRAKGFDMTIVAYDPYWPEAFASEYNIKRMNAVEDLLKISDMVSLHANLTKENHNLINRYTLSLMKPTAFIVNCARGGLINESDLYQALKDGVIAGAAIDAWEQEPPLNSPLLQLNNVLAMPHTAGFTFESLINMNQGATEQIIQYLNGQVPTHIVNPQVLPSN